MEKISLFFSYFFIGIYISHHAFKNASIISFIDQFYEEPWLLA